MKNRNISFNTVRLLKKFNDIRKNRADVFALTHRDVLASLIDSERTESQIVNEMNKLGLRTAKGQPWTMQSMTRLYKRLHSLLLNDPFAQPRNDYDSFDQNDLVRMDEIYADRLEVLYLTDGNDATCDKTEPSLPAVAAQYKGKF